ncbi:MAG: hypothetical protein JXJ19_07285 [Elusimicrobia bacterium]|nr:hypothetical protein [Elusimicrobiota bacterium]
MLLLLLKYFAGIGIFIVLLFALYSLFLRFMERFGKRIQKGSERKLKVDSTPLIIAGILFLVVVFAKVNKIVFISMSIIFAIKSIYGKLTWPRGISLFIGSFLLSLSIGGFIADVLTPGVSVLYLVVSMPFLVIGFINSREKDA